MSTGAATQLVITTEPSPTDASGAALATQPVVKVEDSGGNVVTTNSSTVTANFTSGGVSLTNPTKAAASGVATFSGLALNALAGNYTLTFSDGGLTTAVSSTITVSTGTATQLVITTEPSSTANSGAALATQPVVKVEDSGGNVVTSVNTGSASASIASGSGGSIAAGGTSGTFSSGVATFSALALNGVNGNVYTLTFTGDGFTPAASSNITDVHRLGHPAGHHRRALEHRELRRRPRHPARGQGRGLRRQRGHLGQHGHRQRDDRLGLRRLHRRGRHLGHLLLGRGHLLGAWPSTA